MGAVPVERPQDVSYQGQGHITSIQGNTVYGQDTSFQTQLHPNATIVLKDIKKQLIVTEVISQNEATFRGLGDSIQCDSPFKVIPKLDQSQMYADVWNTLKQGKVIGIFPEGGSHD